MQPAFHVPNNYAFNSARLDAPLGLEAKQGSYALVDLLARYRFDEHFTGTVNVNNLFDKQYYASTSIYSDLYGEPRSLTATWRWEY